MAFVFVCGFSCRAAGVQALESIVKANSHGGICAASPALAKID